INMIGEYSIALAITAPIFLFLNFNLRTLQVTDINDETRFREYFVFRIVSSTLAFLIVFLITVLSGYEKQVAIVIILIAILKFVESLSDLIYGFFQQKERMEYISISKI